MLLPAKRGIANLPAFDLTEESRNTLVDLYNEMILVHNNPHIEFDQDNCQICVIGNAIRSRIVGKEFGYVCNLDHFHKAVDSILQVTVEDETEFTAQKVTFLIKDFLFMSVSTITHAAMQLNLPPSVDGIDKHRYYAIDACVRIAGLLNLMGYTELVADLQDLPTE